jgi:hypothetical protein
MKTYTIKEILFYLKGCRLNDGNGVPCKEYNLALNGAIAFLANKEDGIQGVLEREQWYIQKMPLDKYVGAPCCRLAKDGQQRGATGTIEKVDNKKRKLFIRSCSHSFWISTKTFFKDWTWGKHVSKVG